MIIATLLVIISIVVVMSGTTYFMGLNFIYKSIGIVIFSGIILFLMIEFFIKKIILDRLFAFKNALNDITIKKDFNQKIPVEGKDEIADLVENSNKMLDVISASQMQLVNMITNITNTNSQLNSEIKAREAAEAELARLNSNMIIASRRAGMADVASSVLHNIGNTLNSVNVSAALINEKIAKSEIDNLLLVAKLLENHQDNMDNYLAHNAKGKQIPGFIIMLAAKWQAQKALLMEESSDLLKNIDLIKEVIASQQGLSTMISTNEHCKLSNLIDDALFFCKKDIKTRHINLIKNYIDTPDLYIDRIKVLQILVNLVKNAIESLTESIIQEKIITIQIKADNPDYVVIEIIDNGVGIDEDNLDKIFQFGFTTKIQGHGIGLHGSCNSAQELGGKLSVHSNGVNKGATLTLLLPYETAETTGDRLGRNQTDTPVAD